MTDSLDNETQHDRVLASVLSQEGGSVPAFLNAVFGFLSRNCPEELYNSSQISGEHLISQSYCKWRQKYLHDKTQKSLQSLQCTHEHQVPPAVAEEVVTTEEITGAKAESTKIPAATNRTNTEDNNPYCHFNVTNGAIRDSYAWTQSNEDVEVRIAVPNTIRKGKQVKVKLQAANMEVAVQGSSSSWQTVVAGAFLHSIKVEDSVWSLVPGDHICINVEKAEERWWDRLLKNEDPIDLKKIAAERDFSTLPEEDQQKIQELVWNKQQQELGRPTSDQMKMESMLRDAWNAEGSPFSGQPYDPSVINFTPNVNFHR